MDRRSRFTASYCLIVFVFAFVYAYVLAIVLLIFWPFLYVHWCVLGACGAACLRQRTVAVYLVSDAANRVHSSAHCTSSMFGECVSMHKLRPQVKCTAICPHFRYWECTRNTLTLFSLHNITHAALVLHITCVASAGLIPRSPPIRETTWAPLSAFFRSAHCRSLPIFLPYATTYFIAVDKYLRILK